MKFNTKLFFEAISQIAEQNLITKEETLKIIEDNIYKTFENKFDPDAKLEIIISESEGKFQLINHSKLVVSDDEYQEEYRPIEISLSLANKLNKNSKEGDIVSEEVDFEPFAKIIANQIKQLVTQNVREKKKEAIFAKHKSLKGEMIEAEVTSVTQTYAILKLDDGSVAFMPAKLRNLKIPLSIGEKIKVYVEDVLKESKDSQIIVSNGSPALLRRVIEAEVPEITEGIVEIVKISRIAGERAKVAVKSLNPEIDAVGAIIGAAGKRINAIVKKLDGEKIDVIPWSENIDKFVADSLSPAKVISVIDKSEENNNHKIIITPNRHLTLAIGKFGSNAKLAAELTNSRLDVMSIEKAKEDGIDIAWNGNIDEQDLEKIESGQRFVKKNNNNSNYSSSSQPFNAIDIDSDISTFAESIGNSEVSKVEEINTFEVNDEMFSEDELKQMENNFELDSELLDFDMDENGDVNFEESED